jgi:hypothetical protein
MSESFHFFLGSSSDGSTLLFVFYLCHKLFLFFVKPMLSRDTASRVFFSRCSVSESLLFVVFTLLQKIHRFGESFV